MNVQLLLVAFGLFLLGMMAESSYAATIAFPTSDPSLPEIHMQVVVRNPDGVLVSYFEPTLWYISDVGGVHALLDTKETKVLIHKNNNMYQKITFVDHFVMYDTEQITSEPLYYGGKQVLSPRHDGIILKSGYTIDAYWNILRIVN